MLYVASGFDGSNHKHCFSLVGTKQANCKTSGYEFYRCAICGATHRVTLPALGHEYVYVSERQFEHGIPLERSIRKCRRCGAVDLNDTKILV